MFLFIYRSTNFGVFINVRMPFVLLSSLIFTYKMNKLTVNQRTKIGLKSVKIISHKRITN